MNTSPHSPAQTLRIDVQEVRNRQQSGLPITFLDVRNIKDWESSPHTIRSAIRVRAEDWHMDRSWPKEQLTVVY